MHETYCEGSNQLVEHTDHGVWDLAICKRCAGSIGHQDGRILQHTREVATKDHWSQGIK